MEWLLLVLAVIYAAECFVWLVPGEVLFRSLAGERHTVVAPGAEEGFRMFGRTLALARLLPTGEAIVCGPAGSSEGAAEAHQSLRANLRAVRVSRTILFAWAFAAMPTLWFLLGPVGLLGSLAGLLIADGVVHALHLRALRRARPETSFMRRLSTWVGWLSPGDLMHAGKDLERTALAGFDPLVAASVLVSPPDLSRYSAALLADAEPGTEVARALETRLRSVGLDPVVLAAPPAPDSAASRSFCPRCRRQYRAESGVCPDCNRPLWTLLDSGAAGR